ncbi:transposase [Prosthecobacter sp.]|uniref:transposase n=1 Tax=Prosthecobacter sp. TaxID=1965333 RepID=UPI0037838371
MRPESDGVLGEGTVVREVLTGRGYRGIGIPRYIGGMPKKPLSQPLKIPERPVFTAFEEKEDFWMVPGYERNLPHWRLAGASYFVTFRLADSLPAEVILRWKQDEAQWLFERGVNIRWQRDEPERFRQAIAGLDCGERATFQREMARQFFVELDECHGCCALREPDAHALVAEALRFFHGQRLWVGDFVVMPNHVHVIAQPFEEVPLEEWLYSVKRFTAARLMQREDLRERLMTRAGRVWQPESFDRVIRDLDELRRTREYIEKNPRGLRMGEFHLHRAEWIDALL